MTYSAHPDIEFRVAKKLGSGGEEMVEILEEGELLATVYADRWSVRVVSKYAIGCSFDKQHPAKCTVKLSRNSV